MTELQNRSAEGQGAALFVPLAAVCIALNVALGTLINLIRVPIYLDAVGTVIFALLFHRFGWRGFLWSCAVGAFSFGLSGILFNPVLLWFIPTQLAIATYCYLLAGPVLRDSLVERPATWPLYLRVLLLGLGLGIVAGTVSAPIIALVFGGITGAGASIITAVLLKAGDTLFKSVLASGLASEPLDKLLQLSLAVILIRLTPGKVLRATGYS